MSDLRLSLFSIEAELLGLIEQREYAHERLVNDLNTPAEETRQKIAVIDGLIRQYLKAEVKKVDGCAGAIKQYETMAEVHMKESDRLKQLAEREQETADRIREMVIEVMQEFGEKKLRGRLNTLTVRGNGGVQPLQITQPDLVPDDKKCATITIPLTQFLALKDTLALRRAADVEEDRKAIREALERGEGVPGCRLAERGVHLRVE